MSLSLPPVGHPVRGLFDVADVAAIGSSRAQQSKLSAVQESKRKAREFFAAVPEARAMHAFVLRMDGTLQLWRFGCRGGAESVWTFGKLA